MLEESLRPFGGEVPVSRVSGKLLTEDAKSLAEHWDLTEAAAHAEFERFKQDGGLARYKGSVTRDAGPQAKDSCLSHYFQWPALLQWGKKYKHHLGDFWLFFGLCLWKYG